MHRSIRVGLATFAALTLVAARAEDPPLRGYTAESSRVQREWEAKFRAIPDAGRIREMLRTLSSRPNHLGSAHQKQNAEMVRDLFRSWGWQADIEEFRVLFPTPKERLLELVAPTKFTARLDEPVLKEDPTSSQKSEQLPTYNSYSGDGDVTAPLVYVNYGTPADYDVLARQGISVKGAIVIARYGGSWRGIKPKVAYEHGAVGCLIYSDPKDDGYAQGEVYPAGPWRPKDGVQRGSVMDMPVYPGDPTTPGVGSKDGVQRLDRKDAQTIMKIPVLPISYADAQPLLAAITGPVAPAEWRGALPITYRIGPGPARVHLKLAFNWDIVPLYDVIARLPGSTWPDEWVVRGNHMDGWVNGAEDPLSGLAPELEEARAMGELLKQGWRPKRTIVYAAWDGEEHGLIGSTEWAEQHAKELQEKAVLYINSDGNGRGFLNVEGSHYLEALVNDVAKVIEDPETKETVWKRSQARVIRTGDAKAKAEARGGRANLRIGALGSGSDYTPFIQHLGIPTLNVGYGGEDGGGIYHSIYDSFAWYTRFSDTSFVYGRALAQTIGTMIMRTANAEVLPYEFDQLAETARGYAADLKKLRDDEAAKIAETNRQLDDGTYRLTDDPWEPTHPPAREALAPSLEFSALDNSLDSLARAAQRYDRAMQVAMAQNLASVALGQLNGLLRTADQQMLLPDGLPKRPWFKHSLYAPGLYTGYGVKTMPGVREAIDQHDWTLANAQILKVSAALDREASLVNRAADVLERKNVVP
ncbi:MAG: transferrin receptor-like dimerization domain-containing protein [Gemmatimonadota bacterium]|nr:transferrin receptor-like dimerization domain-containing protein [Gemmatimonadota bacterium]